MRAIIQVAADGDYVRAARTWERALELDPRTTMARGNRGLWLYGFAYGDWERADAELRLAIEEDPLNATLHATRGMCLVQAGRAEEAVAETRRALEIDRESFVGWWAHLMALAWADRFQEAIAAADVALGISGRHPYLLVELGIALARSGQMDRAEAVLEELLARKRAQFVAPGYLSALCGVVGRIDEAIRFLKEGRELGDVTRITALHWRSFENVRRHPAFEQIMGAASDARVPREAGSGAARERM